MSASPVHVPCRRLLAMALLLVVAPAAAHAITFVHETIDNTTDAGQNNDLELDGAGQPHVAYWDFTNKDLEYAVRVGGVWMRETVDAVNSAGQLPSLAIDSSDRPRIAYFDATGLDLRYAERNGGAWTISAVDTAGIKGSWASLALSAADEPRISYHDQTITARDLRYSERNAGVWTIEVVDTTGIVGAGTSLALDASGDPHIAYHDQTNRNLKYATKSGGVWTIEVVDGAGQTGLDPDLALDSSGRPHVVYRDIDAGNLHYAVKDGGVWTTEIVTFGPEAGINPSLALDPDDVPHVSFYHGGPDDLFYLHRIGPGNWTGAVVASAGDVGFDSSLELGANRLPRISYYDFTNEDLLFAEQVSPILVPTHFATIQEAIDAAMEGDTIRIESGIYTGFGNKNLDFGGKNLVLGSLVPGTAELDLEGSGRAFHFHNFESRASVVEGLVIRNGDVSNGSAIRCVDSSPTFRDLQIVDNDTGSAIWCQRASPRIEDCFFGNNLSTTDHGGAMAFLDASFPEVVDCDLASNQADPSLFLNGGAIWIRGASPTITGTRIRGSRARDGGAIYADDLPGKEPEITLDDCVVAGNLAESGNGGALWLQNANATIISCTFTDNHADLRGGAIYLVGDDTLAVEHTILWGDCADVEGDEVFLVDVGGMDPHSITFECSDVDTAGLEGGGTVSFLGGNIDADPRFTLAIGCELAPSGGEYDLECDSPCHAHVAPCGIRIGASIESGGCDLVDVETPSLPVAVRLRAPVPNPSAGTTSLGFELPRRTHVRLALYDPRGRLVRVLADGVHPAGSHTLRWDGRDRHGRRSPAGIYYQRLRTEGVERTQPLVLLR